MIPSLYNPPSSAEKKITEGNTWKARTNPIEGVPSGSACPGPSARGPNKNTAPLWEALNSRIRESLIHCRADLEPANQKVRAPNAQARTRLPKIVGILILVREPVAQANPERRKKPQNEINR